MQLFFIKLAPEESHDDPAVQVAEDGDGAEAQDRLAAADVDLVPHGLRHVDVLDGRVHDARIVRPQADASVAGHFLHLLEKVWGNEKIRTKKFERKVCSKVNFVRSIFYCRDRIIHIERAWVIKNASMTLLHNGVLDFHGHLRHSSF